MAGPQTNGLERVECRDTGRFDQAGKFNSHGLGALAEPFSVAQPVHRWVALLQGARSALAVTFL